MRKIYIVIIIKKNYKYEETQFEINHNKFGQFGINLNRDRFLKSGVINKTVLS